MKKFLATLSLFLLASCSTLSVDTVDSSAPSYNPTPPAQIDVKTLKWQVINNVDVQNLCKQNNTDLVLYALTPSDFENLLLNTQDTDRYIEEENSLIIFYRGTSTSSAPAPTGTTNGQ